MHIIDRRRGDLPAVHGGKPIFKERFRFIRPSLPPIEHVLEEYEPGYRNAILTNATLVARFEREAAEWIGVRHCVAVSSCTSGLTLVMRALGLSGEVILPSMTFFATAHAARWNNLQPVFADCSAESWNISPADVEARITDRTSAIVGVHLYGNPCDVEALQEIASRHRLKLIFDAAHAFGSCRGGVSMGGFGDAEVFSLSPTKLLVAGEGGLVATNDEHLAQFLRTMRNYGDSGRYDPEWVGANARMSEFNAALALQGLPMVEEKVSARTRIAKRYTQLLSALPGTAFQAVHPEDTHSFKDYSVHISAEEFGMDRDALASALLAENIETKKYFYPPLHQQRIYRAYHSAEREPLPNTEYVAGNILSLPIYESLSDEMVDGTVQAIRRLYEYERARQAQASPAERMSHAARD